MRAGDAFQNVAAGKEFGVDSGRTVVLLRGGTSVNFCFRTGPSMCDRICGGG